jgi:RNA polymerase sigma-70 factor, ECF subfamily
MSQGETASADALSTGAQPDIASTDSERQRFEELLPTVYDELHALAGAVLKRNRIVDSMCTTSLIQDVYVRLANRGLTFRDQSHFLCLAARAMRMVLIDRARRGGAAKRGGGDLIVPMNDEITARATSPDLLAVDEALNRLAAFDERKSRIVELRFFGGLSVEETAQALEISPATVKREWTLARAWLLREIGQHHSRPH